MLTVSRASGVISNPDPDASIIRIPLTTETFTGADTTNIVGRSTDCQLGGSPLVWQGTANAWGITSGRLVSTSTAAAALGVPSPASDYEWSVVVVTAPTAAGAVLLDVRRASLAISPAPDGYRLGLSIAAAPAAGAPAAAITMSLLKRASTVQTTLASGLAAVVGDRVTIRVKSGTGAAAGKAIISVLVNGSVVASYTDPTPIVGSGFAGLGSATNLAGLTLDSVILSAA